MARALPAELSKLELSDRTITFELEEGEVVAEKQWSETNVGYTAQRNFYGDQWLSGINSTVTEILELFIRTDSGREISQRLYDSGLSARAGNKVALLKADGKLYRVYNLDIGEWRNLFKLSDSVASRAPAPKVPGKFNTVLRFLLVGVLAGFALYLGFAGWADYLTGTMADKLLQPSSFSFGSWTFDARTVWFSLLAGVFLLPTLVSLSRLACWKGRLEVLGRIVGIAVAIAGVACIAYTAHAMLPKVVHYDMLKQMVQHDYNGWDAGSLFFFLTGFKDMYDVSAFFAALNGVLIGAVSAGKALRRRKAALQEAEQRGEEASQNIFKIKAHLDRINHFVMKQAG